MSEPNGYTEEERIVWAKDVLRQHDVEPEQGADEDLDDFRARLTHEIGRRGLRVEPISHDGRVFHVRALRRPDDKGVLGSSRGHGHTPEDALLMCLAVILAP